MLDTHAVARSPTNAVFTPAQEPVAKGPAAVDERCIPSGLALLVGRICPICSLLAPCQPGTSLLQQSLGVRIDPDRVYGVQLKSYPLA